jgi:hypothetical protein
MPGDLFRTIIVTAADAPLARAIAAGFGPGGVGMWITPLSASGEEPATHYISSGLIPAEFAGLSPCSVWEMSGGEWVRTSRYPGDAATVFAYASQAGLSVTLEQIEAVFANSDATEQPPFDAMARLGLSIIDPPILVTNND